MFFICCASIQPPLYQNSHEYTIAVGSQITQQLTFTPFSHCKGSKFYILVCAEGQDFGADTCSYTPDWILMQSDGISYSVQLNKITKVQNITVQIKAIMKVPRQITDFSKYSSNIELVKFEFINSNADVLSYNANTYTVINKLNNFTISFADTERDNIQMSILNAGSLNAYVQKYQSNSTYLLIVQADDGVNTQTNVVLKYTDSYHQDSQYWKNLTIYISIFASEPPRYNSPLPSVSISACDCKIATLPIATDPDGDSFTVNLDQDAPDWIKLISSETIQLCPSNVNVSKGMTSKMIKIILLQYSAKIAIPC